MKFTLTLLTIIFLAFTAFGQAENDPANFNFGFEKNSDNAKLPEKWQQWGSGYFVKIDGAEKRSGNFSVSIVPGPEANIGSFGAAAYPFPANYEGKEIELRGYLKLKDVSDGYAGLFLRVDGDGGVLQFDNMQSRGPSGTADWTQYSIKLRLPEEARTIFVGGLLTGKGQAWLDDLEVLIDGKDIKEAKTRVVTVFKAGLDKEFDKGSKVDSLKLDKSKIENLAVLGKVWGFLKYYHPAVARGDHNWDYELFRVLPKILAAKNKTARNEVLFAWAESLGAFETAAAAADAGKIKLNPDLSWLNTKNLGDKLTGQLNRVKNAKREGEHYYVGFFPNIGNPQFKHEDAFRTINYPDAGFRLLGLFRFWNIIQYFNPNRHLIGEDWNNTLPEFIPMFFNAPDEFEYKKASLALIARIHDTHANVWNYHEVIDKYRGKNIPPVKVTFIEDSAVVTGYWDQALAEKAGLKIGDVIETVNGKKMADVVKEKLALAPASNYPTQLRDIAQYLLRTNENSLNIKYKRDNTSSQITLETFPMNRLKYVPEQGAAFKLIRPDISYLYPGTLKEGEISKLIPEIAKTKALVIDMRCYPSDFIVFSLGEFLMPKPTGFVKFSHGSLDAPGAFTLSEPLAVGKDNPDSYKGKIVILVNETTQSSAEYHAMAFRAAPGAVVIGSTTAGADGNVSRFSLPGGINTMISGIGIYYPDGRETQRIGIVPDIVVKPTIKGIKEGKDEVLEKALEIINSK